MRKFFALLIIVCLICCGCGNSNQVMETTVPETTERVVNETELVILFTNDIHAGKQTLVLDTAEAEMLRDKRVLILDDVISTGESLHAVEVLMEKCGANVVGRMAILAEGDAIEHEDITVLAPLPLFNADGSVKA